MIPHEASESKTSCEKKKSVDLRPQSEQDGAAPKVEVPEEDNDSRICNKNSSSAALEADHQQNVAFSVEQLIRQQHTLSSSSWRPARISITIDLDAPFLGNRTLPCWMSIFWGVVLHRDARESGRILVTKMPPSENDSVNNVGEGGDENDETVPECPLQEGEYVLEQVNGRTDFRDVEIHEILDHHLQQEGCASLLTFILVAREEEEDGDMNNKRRIHPSLLQASLVTSPTTLVQQKESEEKEDLLGIEFRNDDKHAGVNLCIKSIAKEGPWAESVLQAGDLLLTFNGADCRDITVSDAHFFLQIKTALEGAVTVNVVRPNAKNWAGKAKRASVAVGGGAMVTVGGVLMATPLHPVGHGLAIGGVALLGTEFEAPRNAMQSARASFKRALRRRQWSSKEDDLKGGETRSTEI